MVALLVALVAVAAFLAYKETQLGRQAGGYLARLARRAFHTTPRRVAAFVLLVYVGLKDRRAPQRLTVSPEGEERGE